MNSLLLLGWALFVIGLVWLVFKSYKLGGILWAILVFLVTVPAGLLFCIKKKDGWIPFVICLTGWLIIVGFSFGFIGKPATMP